MKIIKRLAVFLLTAFVAVTLAVTGFAEEYDDPEIELTPEFTNEVFDDEGDYPVQFVIGFGTHTKMPDGTSAKLVIRPDEGANVEGMDDQGVRVYGYSSIASDRYVCKSSSNGGFYPNYGETVRLKPYENKNTVLFTLTVSDKDNNVIHTEDIRVYTLKRDGVIAISDEGYDDAEQKLEKPLYRVLLFLKTPLGTVVKIIAFVVIAGGMFAILHRKEIKRFFRAKKAEKIEGSNGGDKNG